MKAILSFIVLIIVALLFYAYLSDMPKYSARLKDSMTVRPKGQDSPPVSSVPAPMAAPGATTPPPTAAAPVSNSQAILPRLEAAARQHGVTILRTQFSGKNVTVTLDWIGDVATNGGDI